MASPSNSRLPSVLAFCQRAFGLHPRSKPLENLPARSLRSLERLSRSPNTLGFKIALQQLQHDWDLLDEKAVSNDDALRLQIRVLELASDDPEAEALLRRKLG